MSQRYQGGLITASYNGLKVPDAPTIGTATGGDTSASVTFTAPSNTGGGAITGYTVISSPGGITGTGTSSPVTVSGLTNGTAYTFTVLATNAYGTSAASAASNSVTPAIVQGQQLYTTSGTSQQTYSWVAPAGVTSVSVVCVGGGGAGNSSGGSGAGGGLGWYNNISVTPGSSYTVVVGGYGPTVGGDGKQSYFVNAGLVSGSGGPGQGTGGSYVGQGGGNGGNGGTSGTSSSGAGAGGYAGAGGNFKSGQGSGNAGSGGGGGSGGVTVNNFVVGAGGGGVGMLGQGANGAAGVWGGQAAGGGGGGSGGTDGTSVNTNVQTAGVGGEYGGGGGCCSGTDGGRGAVGAVRIIWPGTTRYFPSTNTGDV